MNRFGRSIYTQQDLFGRQPKRSRGYSSFSSVFDKISAMDTHRLMNKTKLRRQSSYFSDKRSFFNDLSIQNFLNLLTDSRNVNRRLLQQQIGQIGKERAYIDFLRNPGNYNMQSSSKTKKVNQNQLLLGEYKVVKNLLDNKNSSLIGISNRELNELGFILRTYKGQLSKSNNSKSSAKIKEAKNLLYKIQTIKNKKKSKNTNKTLKNKITKQKNKLRQDIINLNTSLSNSNRRKKYKNKLHIGEITQATLGQLSSDLASIKKIAEKKVWFSQNTDVLLKIYVLETSIKTMNSLLTKPSSISRQQKGGKKSRRKYIINPLTGRKILKNGPTARKLKLI